MKKYLLPCNEELWHLSLNIAIQQIGIKEKTGKNDGPEVEAYLKSIGLPKGNPYCVAGHYWSFIQACEQLKLPVSAIPIPKSGLALATYKLAKKKGTEVYAIIEIGDIMIWQKPNKINGHFARVINVLDFLTVKTIEFNTSNGLHGSQRDGDGVFQRKRYTNKLLGDMELICLIGMASED